MKKKLILSLVFISIFFTTVYALNKSFSFDTSKLSFVNGKKIDVLSNFNKEYNLSYSITSSDQELKEEIKKLTKEATYLLLGGTNNVNETNEHYYKRHQEWLKLFYRVTLPKNEKGETDKDSLEYTYDVVAGIVIPSIFHLFQEAGIIYNSYGDIIMSKTDRYVISTIMLPNVKIKSENKEDPMKYDYLETNYYIHYYFMLLDGKYRLFYVYGEDTTEMSEYFNNIAQEEGNKSMSMAPMTHESDMSQIYNFDKLKKLPTEKITNAYKANANNMVFLTSHYNNQVIASSNGFLITDNLIVTTWDFIQKSLVKSQYILAKNGDELLEIEGIVTANVDNDIAVIKVKNSQSSSIVLGDYKKTEKEDPVIMISSKLGTGLNTQTGIVLSNDNYIQTSIPVSNIDPGSPLINQDGEIIGMICSKMINSSISMAINSDALKEIKQKFSSLNANSITSISFDDLKSKYYYVKYDNEKVINTIPKLKWKTYSKIGNISKNIKLQLIKASYADGIVSLRYKNEISGFINSMQLASSFREELLNDEYKLINKSDTKEVYQNKKYKVIIMDEFDYLIIVMVKL